MDSVIVCPKWKSFLRRGGREREEREGEKERGGEKEEIGGREREIERWREGERGKKKDREREKKSLIPQHMSRILRVIFQNLF